jgi:hypothetical protein
VSHLGIIDDKYGKENKDEDYEVYNHAYDSESENAYSPRGEYGVDDEYWNVED